MSSVFGVMVLPRFKLPRSSNTLPGTYQSKLIPEGAVAPSPGFAEPSARLPWVPAPPKLRWGSRFVFFYPGGQKAPTSQAPDARSCHHSANTSGSQTLSTSQQHCSDVNPQKLYSLRRMTKLTGDLKQHMQQPKNLNTKSAEFIPEEDFV